MITRLIIAAMLIATLQSPCSAQGMLDSIFGSGGLGLWGSPGLPTPPVGSPEAQQFMQNPGAPGPPQQTYPQQQQYYPPQQQQQAYPPQAQNPGQGQYPATQYQQQTQPYDQGPNPYYDEQPQYGYQDANAQQQQQPQQQSGPVRYQAPQQQPQPQPQPQRARVQPAQPSAGQQRQAQPRARAPQQVETPAPAPPQQTLPGGAPYISAEDLPAGAVRVTTSTQDGTTVQYYPPVGEPMDQPQAAPAQPRRPKPAPRRAAPAVQPQSSGGAEQGAVAMPKPVEVPKSNDPRFGWGGGQ